MCGASRIPQSLTESTLDLLSLRVLLHLGTLAVAPSLEHEIRPWQATLASACVIRAAVIITLPCAASRRNV
jgi:hypothetical protein